MNDKLVPTPADVEAILGRHTFVKAQLCLSVDESYARALDAARHWFEHGFALLGGEFHDAALTAAPEDLDNMNRVSRAVPGAISVTMATMLQPDEQLRPYVPYSPPAWEDLLLNLGRVPALAALECSANGDDGTDSPDAGGRSLDFVARRIDSDGTWLVLGVAGSPTVFGIESHRARLLELVRDTAERANPVHGEVSWGNDVYNCVLEEGRGSGPRESLPAARRALRGYAWVTVLPEEIGGRLGGSAALGASEAFVEVEHLGGGGYWCRATERLEDYDEAAADRVFDVLASALPPGRPNMWGVRPPNVLSRRDPSYYRPS